MLTVQQAPKGLPAIDVSKLNTATTRDEIDAKHPDWNHNQETWFNSAVMYEGGHLMRKNAHKFLLRRPKEDSSVYQHRLELMTYENNMGTGLGWWQAEMFSSEPKIDLRPAGSDGKPLPDGKLDGDKDKFYNQQFAKDCDKHGTSFVDMAREIFKNLLLYRQCFVLVDLPRNDLDKYATLQDQKDAGALDPYLCAFPPQQVINWDMDDHGNYNWLMVYQKTYQTGFLVKAKIVERWYYYDRQQFRVYECIYDESEGDAGKKQAVNLIQTGYHALAAKNIVPVQCIEFPEGWWLANRAYLPALEHIDTVNVLRWSLRMAGLAVPVIFTDDELTTITLAEYQFIKLGQNDKYEWTEAPGRSWEHLAKRILVLTEEIWRAMYLVAQARSTSATAGAASGVSKQEDMAPSHDVLDGMGAILRTALQNLLTLVIWARGDDGIVPDVTGFTFEDKLTAAELDVIEEVLSLGIPSDSFEREVYKLAVRLVLKGANDDLLTVIFAEIMKGPTRDEKQAQQLQQRFNMVRQNITGAAKDPTQKVETD